jgi:hypothetical protein
LSTKRALQYFASKFVNIDKLEEDEMEIVVAVSRQLTAEYGRSFGEKSLRSMMQFAQIFKDE